VELELWFLPSCSTVLLPSACWCSCKLSCHIHLSSFWTKPEAVHIQTHAGLQIKCKQQCYCIHALLR
jgi:hypothetical protein